MAYTAEKSNKIEGKFYPLQHEEWLKACRELTPAELKTLYYIRTADPYSNGIRLSAAAIARDLSSDGHTISRQTISRAIKRLDQLGFIDMEVLEFNVKLCGKGILVVCEDTDIHHTNIHHTDGVSAHHDRSLHTTRCVSTPQAIATHHTEAETFTQQEFQNSKTYKDYIKTLSDKTTNEKTNEQAYQENDQYIDVDIVADTSTKSTGQIKNLGHDKFSAPPLDSFSARHEFLVYAGKETPWLNSPRRRNDIFFKPEFMEWHGRRWLEKFPNKRDIHEAIADFRSSLINNPDKIPGRWEEYEGHIIHHAQNIQLRLEHGCQISESEQQKMIQHLPVVSQSTNQNQLPSNAPESENYLAYKPFTPEPEIHSPEERAENIKKLAELMRSKIKPVPQPKESETENRIDKLNRCLADPILRKEVIRKVLRDDSLIVFFDDFGDPCRVEEKQ